MGTRGKMSTQIFLVIQQKLLQYVKAALLLLKDIFLSKAALAYCNNFCCIRRKVLLLILPDVPILPLQTL